MSEMSSFYGGKQGNSIVISKRFDGIDIPQVAGSYVYTKSLYAIDKDGNFIITQDGSIDGAIGVGVVDASGDYIHSTTNFLIKRNSNNYLGEEIPNFAQWSGHNNDGTLISSDSEYVFYPELAQGMVQFFKQGAKTTSEVSYGSYVLIDTMLNMSSANNPDNGKLFRRGMDINSTDGLAGAEYIGQIVGPQGEASELDIDTYKAVTSLEGHSEREYTANNSSIVPGSHTVGDIRFYEDEIKYAWVTIKDSFGRVEGCKLGFKFPTLVEDFEARSMSPYQQRKVGGDGKYYNYDLIKPDEGQYTNDIRTFALNEDSQFILGTSADAGAYKVAAKEGTVYLIEKTKDTELKYTSWQAVTFDGEQEITCSDAETYTLPEVKTWMHPFYQKWQVSIPQGYHGIDSKNVEVIHTATKTPKFKGSTVTIYNTSECSDDDIYKVITAEDESYPLYGSDYVLVNSLDDLDEDDDDARNHFEEVVGRSYMRYGAAYDANPAVIFARVKINGAIYYVKKEDCTADILRYREIDYDDQEEGKSRYFYLGDYNTIDRVTISEDGTLSVFYSTGQTIRDLEQKLRWIDTEDTEGITIDKDGSMHVYYNTLDAEGQHTHQDYDKVLDWITEVSLTKQGKFTVLYNNDSVITGYDEEGNPIRGDRYETDVQWIDYVDFSDDGTVTFRWNTDTTRQGTPAYQFPNRIKFLKDVTVQTVGEDGYEGSGDQKIHIKYNNDGQIDRALGEPLNYIIETCISSPNSSYPNVPYSHLLVYYSDPALREKYKDKWVTYPSTKIIDSYIKDETTKVETPVYHVWTQWVDLGQVRGSAGGLHIIKNVASLDELKDSKGNYIPPEKLADSAGTIINPDGAGWACTCSIEGSTDAKNILFYDYETKEWYSIGSIDSESVEPKCIILKGQPTEEQMPTTEDASTLNVNGIWLAAETAIYAQ